MGRRWVRPSGSRGGPLLGEIAGETLSEREQEAAGDGEDSACKFGFDLDHPRGTNQEKDATESHEILADEFTAPRNLCLKYKDQRKKDRNKKEGSQIFKRERPRQNGSPHIMVST